MRSSTPRRRRLAAVVSLLLLGLTAALLALPAAATQACLADQPDDLVDLVLGGGAVNPNGDLQAVCADHSPGLLALSARLGGATDIATHPGWESGEGGLVFQVDVNPPGDQAQEESQAHDYDVVIGRAAGVPAWSVLPAGSQEAICGGPLADNAGATPQDPTYRLEVDAAACLPAADGSAPQVVRVGAYIIFREAGGNPTFDEFPSSAELYGPAIGPEPRPAEVGHHGVVRLAGPTRVQTAIAASRWVFTEDGAADAVVLATGFPPGSGGQPATNSPDALAAAPLATHLDAPLLLLGPPADDGQLTDDVLAEIGRVAPAGSPVYLVGGTAVIDDHVEQQLAGAGYEPVRLAGSSREGTALAVALRIDPEPTRIVLADGGRFEFALLGAAYAASSNVVPGGHAVLLLTTADEQGAPVVPDLYTHYLQTDRPGREFVAIGSAAATAATSAGLAADALVADGDDVFATSLAVAQRYGSDDGPAPGGPEVGEDEPLPAIPPLPPVTAAVVASGLRHPDAISGAALAGRFRTPLLYSWPDSLPATTRDWLRALPDRLSPGLVMGGPAALTDAVPSQLSVCGVGPAQDATPECRPR